MESMHSMHHATAAHRCCPHTGVSRCIRMFTAGAVWTAVGLMLVSWAIGWAADAETSMALIMLLTGTVVGAGAWVGMRALARKNIERLGNMPERGSLITFISGKSWLITAFMIAMGSTLRHSALSKSWLVLPYFAMGLALFLASLEYYRHLLRSR